MLLEGITTASNGNKQQTHSDHLKQVVVIWRMIINDEYRNQYFRV